MTTVLYSATFGGYDVVPELPHTPGVDDRVMFTDDPELEAPGWQVQVEKAVPGEHPRMSAKRYRMFPHVYLPDAARRVWMDASTTLLLPEAPDMALARLSRDGLALHVHPDRDCIYDEAVASMSMEKYADQPIAEQVACYRRSGHPKHWGLYACGVIASDHRADMLLEHWWSEVCAWSWQDQISFPVVLRRTGAVVSGLPHNQVRSPWFRPGGHTRED